MKQLYLTTLAIVVSIFSYLDGYAQRLTFSSELGYFNEDENIGVIRSVWEDYIDAVDAGSDVSRFWVDGSFDLHIGLHKDGLLNTFNIRKITDEIYEINTIAYYPDCAIRGGLINSIYKVCAIRIGDAWHLMNYFDATKHRYISYGTDCIDFYVGSGVALDKKRVKSIARFADTFIRNYGIENRDRIIYVAANSIDDCSAMIGLAYTPMRSHKPYAGRTINNIVLSTRLDHIHEVVHAIMLPLYPKAPLFLHEGIATYYGGVAKQEYKAVKSIAKAFIEQRRVDFNGETYFGILLNDDVQLSNVVAAAIIEYALQQGCESEVLRLFEATTYDQVFDLLNVANDQRNEFICGLF